MEVHKDSIRSGRAQQFIDGVVIITWDIKVDYFEDKRDNGRVYIYEIKTQKTQTELPDEWHPNWLCFCRENCDVIGQCGWIRENCPHTDFKLKFYHGSASTVN